MSFSTSVKSELISEIHSARHCQISELAALFIFCGRVAVDISGVSRLDFYTENELVIKKIFTLLKKAFNIVPGVSEENARLGRKAIVYKAFIEKEEESIKILSAIKALGEDAGTGINFETVDNMVVKNMCCKRAFLRGCFLAAGSVGDPNKAYHLEIVCSGMKKAEQIRDIIQSFEIDAKIVARKNNYVVYIKEGSAIVEFLNVIEAHVALMELENVRIVKEMRNSVNRQVNCETANLNKTITAAVKQVEDIEFIQNKIGLDTLNDSLRQMAELRLAHPEAALNELGKLLNPPIGKSGVNHRLRKISEIADNLRDNV